IRYRTRALHGHASLIVTAEHFGLLEENVSPARLLRSVIAVGEHENQIPCYGGPDRILMRKGCAQ
ncbi:MAG: hypothetical protein SFV23_14405, partial [Planctomycetaceae bacterium]|nr:hypothetical protein [Planctomycetaceae bacterium]